MCGIIGQFQKNQPLERTVFEQKVQQLLHRGPDGQGIWMSPDEHFALGHTRLSFLDLSQKGSQPFTTSDQKVILTFNGEIYNFKALRAELKANYQFTTQSDTEVVLAAYLHWGADCVKYFEGMFAFCILDLNSNSVFLARDPFGIKPLYYALNEHLFVFGSELKALIPTPGLSVELDPTSVIDYLVYRYVPSPKTIWKGIHKLAPAQTATLDLSTFELEIDTYWDPIDKPHFEQNKFNFEVFSIEFEKSVQQHLEADVPVGGFLSGGYDSSALAKAAKTLNTEYATFTVGFSAWENSEALAAAKVASQLQQENHQVELDDSSLALLDKMPTVYDEPIADISIIPTFAVSSLAAQYRKAVLSGEGADELFIGYHWQKEWHLKQQLPFWKRLLRPVPDLLSFYTASMAMGEFNRSSLLQALTPAFAEALPQDLSWFYRSHLKTTKEPIKALQYLDQKCFMGELVLTKIDRASMANSLEVRVPFLKKQSFEQIHHSPTTSYTSPGISKFPIYEYLRSTFSKEHLQRPKQGFVGPDSYYMNKEFYQKAFENAYLVSDGIIQKKFIEAELKQDYSWRLWKLLVLEKWYAHWRQYRTKEM
jgi:asparagine synthase (glutamine-hydrolysing)